MIDIKHEKVNTLTEATKRLPRLGAGYRVHVTTVWNWSKRGLRSVRLETIVVGGQDVSLWNRSSGSSIV